MKILFTGGGTGGHFYPIIAIAESVNDIVEREHLLPPKLYFAAPRADDERALFDNNLELVKISAGKRRRYASILNYTDLVKSAWGVMTAVVKIFGIFPDVIVSKGGYASVPALVAGRLFRIPIVIHESDSVPGRANAWAAKFATAVAVSYPQAADYFKKTKSPVIATGQPIRKGIMTPAKQDAEEFFKLEPNVPTILIVGGSQGAQIVNEAVLGAIEPLLAKYQIIHQVGQANLAEYKDTAAVILEKSPYRDRYKLFGFLDDLNTRMAAGAASLVVSRAGSAIFEIALWNLPSIIIPITDSNGNHQQENAFAYARAEACIVIEESNLSPHVLQSEIDRLMDSPDKRAAMSEGAKKFSTPDAAEKIARKVLEIALSHEK